MACFSITRSAHKHHKHSIVNVKAKSPIFTTHIWFEMSSALHSAIKAHATCFRCKQKFTNKNQANIHQRYCTSLVKSDGMGREFLESFSTTFTQSALSKDIQQGNIRNPHSFQVGGAYRSQLLQYNSLSRQRWTSNKGIEHFFIHIYYCVFIWLI